ncbi:chemotaxis protein CheW [Psychrosphaera haliotis]|uniref:Chemotaxis protein CheW n=1 Tax=Psychrosphaera haliotis TaxID=555083 RepID=A0A6N8FFM9_9GAMM|nr:chemotaxis protein CheW [Psychrosphaera haliotis]MUH73472.1 chemotaxis protein CheW [Psychrosphaera haliotis]
MNEVLSTSQLGNDDNVDLVQYLTFMMDDEEYGIEILSVQEIRGWESMTSIPNSEEYVKGVINLRGTVVPVVDLRIRFNLSKFDYNELTVIIIVKVMIDKKTKIMGIVVDAVSDVYNIEKQKAKKAPDIGDSETKNYIEGLINVGDKMVVLLDLEKVLLI